ncbi:hypothetical protein BX600DRAFT_442862 [Xylariales sp. PMI_506]|nr:hypothetical protein BX600DRAFT_442862 [Xylariales sp. PMI_506]
MGKPDVHAMKAQYPPSAPPPYSYAPNQAPPMAPSNQYQYQQPAPPPPASIPRQFPASFSLYHPSTFSKTYLLGEHQSQPLYAVALHTGWSGKPDVVLHAGPDEKRFPPIASVDANTMSRSSTVTLPPVPGSGLDCATERAEFSGFGHGKESFSIEVDASGGRREAFEWRHSHGGEVDGLGGRGRGWKLVRLAASGSGASRSSDGKEVVAVWANASMSATKILNFEFLGSGATGVLGERWAIMAVITALRIWDKERKARSSSAAAAGGASA